ncbi:hypothetical protein CS388_04165 [Porphyromonas gingivalis]|nr:hypothetical protein CS388_04165 [Porphyromonas gingivalis]
MAINLYINQKRFIYKSETIYIQIENGLYINRNQPSTKRIASPKRSLSCLFHLKIRFLSDAYLE